VRQLENVVERAVLLSTDEHIRSGDLGLEPASEVASDGSAPHFGSLAEGLEGLLSLTEIPPLREALEVPERLLIQRALELTDGSRKATAVMLGINRTTLFNKMRKYGLLERDWNRLGPPPSPSSPLDPPTPTG
jgi:DNA-binding NtrC family response regulator